MRTDDYYDRKAEQSGQMTPFLFGFAAVVLTMAVIYVIVAKMMGG
jgi:hypothetical protein